MQTPFHVILVLRRTLFLHLRDVRSAVEINISLQMRVLVYIVPLGVLGSANLKKSALFVLRVFTTLTLIVVLAIVQDLSIKGVALNFVMAQFTMLTLVHLTKWS